MTFGAYKVFVDSNVLYSRTLRDWLGLLYLEQESHVFLVFWSEDVLADTIHHLRKAHPEWDGAKTAQVRDLITTAFSNGRVSEYKIDESYRGKDRDDAHVHAAAVSCGADILLTLNVRDFCSGPGWDDSLPYEVMTPDEFYCLVDDTAPYVVAAAAHRDTEYWLKKRGEANSPEQLRKAGAPEFAERVRRHLTGV